MPIAHWLYGAVFLILGGVLVVESLAGGVWHRSRLRALVWPSTLVALGLGVVIVSYVDSDQRLIHFLLGVSLVACGVFEARQRLRQIPRRSADIVVVFVLVLSGILIGPFHYEGAILSDGAQMGRTDRHYVDHVCWRNLSGRKTLCQWDHYCRFC